MCSLVIQNSKDPSNAGQHVVLLLFSICCDERLEWNPRNDTHCTTNIRAVLFLQAETRVPVTEHVISIFQNIVGNDNVSTAESVRDHHGKDESYFRLCILHILSNNYLVLISSCCT